jgi:translation elongation factor EF-G
MSWLVITTIQEQENDGDKAGFPLIEISIKSYDEHRQHSVISISNNSWEVTIERIMSLGCRNVAANSISASLIKFCGKHGKQTEKVNIELTFLTT